MDFEFENQKYTKCQNNHLLLSKKPKRIKKSEFVKIRFGKPSHEQITSPLSWNSDFEEAPCFLTIFCQKYLKFRKLTLHLIFEISCSRNWSFNWIFAGYTGNKNQVWNRQKSSSKIKFGINKNYVQKSSL